MKPFSLLDSESTSYFVGGETNSGKTGARKKAVKKRNRKTTENSGKFSPITSIHCRSRSTKRINSSISYTEI